MENNNQDPIQLNPPDNQSGPLPPAPAPNPYAQAAAVDATKFDGWLKFFAVIAVIAPFTFLYDLSLVLGEESRSILDAPGFEDLKALLYAAFFLDIIFACAWVIFWFFFFAHRRQSIVFARFLTLGLIGYNAFVIIMYIHLSSKYGIGLDGEEGGQFRATIWKLLMSFGWLVYWSTSTRVRSVFTR